MEENFLRVLRDRTAGDPMRQEVRWTDLTYEQIAGHLAEAGTPVSVPVVKQLLAKHGDVTRKAKKSKTSPARPRQWAAILTATGSSRISPGSSRSPSDRTTRS